jgi:L-lactate dehydrogenase complex protein LldG
MSSRETILSRIHSLLTQGPPHEEPPVHPVWPSEKPGAEQMAGRFAKELQAIHGEAICCRPMDEARSRLKEMVDRERWVPLGAMDRPLCRELTAGLEPGQIRWAEPDWTPQGMAELPAGLIEAECLLADTGTAMIACNRPEERLMCYLPPVCIVVATAGRLAEHLPAAWAEIARRAADPQRRGEFVFITGPSRTADIEKILILGVHGPKRLIVLVIGD